MFNLRKVRRLLLVAVFLLCPTLAATAGGQVAYKGVATGSVTSTTPLSDSHVLFTVIFSGRASHLGRFAGEGEVIQNVADGSYSGSFVWTTASGDSIYGTFDGQLIPTETPGLFDNVEYSTIVGGTGRFAGATGSVTEGGYVDLNTLTFFHPFEGTISTVGSAKRR